MWFVIDGEGNTSFSEKTDKAESWTSESAAIKRASAIAAAEPGRVVRVCRAVAEVTAPIGKPTTTRLAKF
ncbi:MAG: hypothetical protein WDM94_09255 [Bauldia sp.]